MAAKLLALGLKNYRGIGPDWQLMPKFKKFNFFIGANNSGKSAVLNFLSSQLSEGAYKISLEKMTPLERFDGGSKGLCGYAFGVNISTAVENAIFKISDPHQKQASRSLIERIVKELSVDGTFWLSGEIGGQPGLNSFVDPNFEALEQIGSRDEWHRLWGSLRGMSGGGLREHWIPESVEAIKSAQSFVVPKINLIPAKRQIGPKSEGFKDYSGKGLIDRLAEIQSPDWNKREDREVFDRINLFVGQVTGDAGARIEIPHNREQILVHMGGRVLPLASLGTGIHEVILIAAFCTISNDQIVCIEEPEIHLHPLMQRRLIKFLNDNTTNQYFIATHSASFIETPGSAIFHVTHGGDQVYIRETILAEHRYEICADLGCRASDIVQANAVVWVEGPSDRIYIRHWLNCYDPDLVEGIHYSVMFYGGRLLSHLGAESDAIEDFISLRSLNRNSIVLMDSDKASAGAKVNETKRRISSAFSGSHELAWITAGREIENYVRPDLLHSCLSRIYPSTYGGMASTGKYDHALHFKRKGTAKRRSGQLAGASGGDLVSTVDKVRLAKEVSEREADLDVLDLKARIAEVAAIIRRANQN